MDKQTQLLLKLSLSSFVFTASLVASTALSLSASEPISSVTKLAQANPCADPKNPCPGKFGSVGGPLAKELQGKPVVVDIYATWCSGCKNIAPTLSQLKKDYAGKANFVVFDVTDKATLSSSEAKAKNLGLSQFLEANKSKTSTVAIVDPATGNILASFRNNPTKQDYSKVLNTAIAKQ